MRVKIANCNFRYVYYSHSGILIHSGLCKQQSSITVKNACMHILLHVHFHSYTTFFLNLFCLHCLFFFLHLEAFFFHSYEDDIKGDAKKKTAENKAKWELDLLQ